jgi:hypothetical protein
MSFPDTVPTLHVSSTQGVCRISGPPEIKTKITINHTDSEGRSGRSNTKTPAEE